MKLAFQNPVMKLAFQNILTWLAVLLLAVIVYGGLLWCAYRLLRALGILGIQ